jgi:transmembrane 9 superfamily member 2/4
MIDGLPAAQLYVDTSTKEEFYNPGFPIGRIMSPEHAMIHNHFNIRIQYHKKKDSNLLRVTGVIINPKSIEASVQKTCLDTESRFQYINHTMANTIGYTYSVSWEESKDVDWGTRWDHYLHVFDPQIHWFRYLLITKHHQLHRHCCHFGINGCNDSSTHLAPRHLAL